MVHMTTPTVEQILVHTLRCLEAYLMEASADRVVPIALAISSIAMDLHAVRTFRVGDPTGGTLQDCDPGDPCQACIAAGKGGR